MTAILIHSLVDFNLYIPANAMVLAWVGGMATSPAMLRSPAVWKVPGVPEIVDVKADTG